MCLVMLMSGAAFPEDLGQFEGAVWRFKLTRKNPQLSELGGLFRVHNGTIYQKIGPGSEVVEKVSGNEQRSRQKS